MIIAAKNKFVILEKHSAPEQSASGLFLPGNKSTALAKVISSAVPEFNTGDVVIIGDRHKAHMIELDNQSYIVMAAEDIAGVVQ